MSQLINNLILLIRAITELRITAHSSPDTGWNKLAVWHNGLILAEVSRSYAVRGWGRTCWTVSITSNDGDVSKRNSGVSDETVLARQCARYYEGGEDEHV